VTERGIATRPRGASELRIEPREVDLLYAPARSADKMVVMRGSAGRISHAAATVLDPMDSR